MGGSSYEASRYRIEAGYEPERSIEMEHMPDLQESVLKTDLDESNLPKNRGIVTTNSPNPIIVAFDGTGSMSQEIDEFYKREPMFHGRLVLQGLSREPEICFMVVNDITSDETGLQYTPFADGSNIDALFTTLWPEKKGGRGVNESYELAFFQANYRTQFTGKLDAKPFMFLYCDETFYDKLPVSRIRDVFGENAVAQVDLQGSLRELDTADIIKSVMDTYDLYVIWKPYSYREVAPVIRKTWERAVGKDRVIEIYDICQPIDTMMGIIALRAGYSLADYCQMMRARNQDEERVENVTKSIAHLTRTIKPLKDRSELLPLKLLDGPVLREDSSLECENNMLIKPDGLVILPGGEEIRVPSEGKVIIINYIKSKIKDSTVIKDSVVMRSKVSRGKKRKDDDESDEL